MRLTKKQREDLFNKYGGRCAYCGEPLADRWHADHVEPIWRLHEWVRGVGFKPTGEALRPEKDTPENLLPACPPCNINKGGDSLEAWRESLANSPLTLRRDAPIYKHAVRFGLIQETALPVIFYFEKLDATPGGEDNG